MVKLFLALIFSTLFFGFSLKAQDLDISGNVRDAQEGVPLAGVSVLISGTTVSTTTNAEGKYSLTVPQGHDVLIFSLFGYRTLEVLADSRLNIDVELEPDVASFSLDDEDLPVVTLSDDDLDGGGATMEVSSLLQGSNDPFVNTAGFTFGSARFRIRGYDSQNVTVMMNGIPMNDPETGRTFFSQWGGLNDVTRMNVSHSGIGVSRDNFGGIGGARSINVRASEYRATNQFSYSNSNRSYSHRAMYTYASGMQENGWALALSGSRRMAQEGFVEGTFYDAWGYFMSAERRLNRNHSIGLVAFGAPSRSGRPSVGTMEVYELTGNNFYNPNWGYQDGEKRNARVNEYHTPWGILTHYWDVLPSLKVNTSAAYSMGKGSSTSLNWFEANDPRPDYYRYLPSFYNESDPLHARYIDRWQNDESFRQLDWDRFYNANRRNLFTMQNVNGEEGNNVTGNRSKYMVEDRRNDREQMLFNSLATHTYSPTTIFTHGVNVSMAKTNQYKLVDDLLGGDFWVDVDQFALRDFSDPLMAQNDINNPNRVVSEGDRFGYDFTGNINTYDVFTQGEFVLPQWDFYYSLTAAYTEFWRTGHMQNGRFPDNSYGDSEKQDFFDYGAKGGITYKITGRHYLSSNAAYMTRAPYFRDAYLSSRVRDDLVPDLNSEQIMSADLTYNLRAPLLKARLTAFYTEFKDQTWSRSFYHDEFRTFVNYSMTGVDQTHMGLELGAEAQVTSTVSVNMAAGTGNYVYSNRPQVTIARDNDREILADNKTVYWKNYKVGGMTHTAASLGFRYNSPRFWFMGGSVNYFDDIYLDINPDRRTEEALSGYVSSDATWKNVIDQEKLDWAYTVDLFAGKSWRIQRRYFINLSLSANNVLNNQDFRIGGFENLRYDTRDIERFPNRYFFSYGTTWFLNLRFRM